MSDAPPATADARAAPTGPGAPARGVEGAPAERHLTDAVRAELRREIEMAGGAEVAFFGRVGDDGRVVEVEVSARGHRTAAPALVQRADGWDVMLHNHPSGALLPSDADLDVASALGAEGIGSMIVSNDAARVHVVVPPRAARRVEPVAPDEVEAFLGRDGPIAGLLGPAYEPRAGQVRMARLVAEAFGRDQVALLEAGTGTGKTFAYLAPAALHALRNGERVVVSTATIHLQEQIARKDAPLLARALAMHRPAPSGGGGPAAASGPEAGERSTSGKPQPRLEAVVVKGRGNYVSLRRAEEATGQSAVAFASDEERDEVGRLAAWARTTRTGDKAELTPPATPGAWEHVESQQDNCLRARCPRFAQCHYFESRRAAARAQVVIVNHHLLFADLAVRLETRSFEQAAVLPPYKRVILDEAHHAEHIAGEYFGASVSEWSIARPLGRLQSKRTVVRGVLPSLQQALLGGRMPPAATRLARVVLEELTPLRDQVASEVEAAFDQTSFGLREALPPAEQRAKEVKLRLRPEHEAALLPLLDAAQGVAVLAGRLQRFAQQVEDEVDERDRARAEGPLREAAAAARRLARAAKALDALKAAKEDPARVRWAELGRDRRGRDTVALKASPLEVGPLLREALFDPLKTVVLSSATLAVEGRFDFVEARLGLRGARRASGDPPPAPGTATTRASSAQPGEGAGPSRSTAAARASSATPPPRPAEAGDGAGATAPPREEQRVLRALIASPFDYARQALLGIPTDMPLPDAPSFDEAVAAAVRGAVLVTRGRAFVLFTSYGQLGRVARRLDDDLHRAGLVPLRQGEAGRTQLLERFRETPGAVLFGTDSFWEGVDVPGDALVLVVIAKLPFRVPSEPLQEARAEAITRRGGDAFRELQLPQAVLKLKQGFGRLIRTTTDRGAVLVLDRRIVTRPYGRMFIESLPPVRVAVAPLAQLLASLPAFTG